MSWLVTIISLRDDLWMTRWPMTMIPRGLLRWWRNGQWLWFPSGITALMSCGPVTKISIRDGCVYVAMASDLDSPQGRLYGWYAGQWLRLSSGTTVWTSRWAMTKIPPKDDFMGHDGRLLRFPLKMTAGTTYFPVTIYSPQGRLCGWRAGQWLRDDCADDALASDYDSRRFSDGGVNYFLPTKIH
jgi:hypothetical protein